MRTVTISPKFQIVIPKAIRELLGLEPGQKLLHFHLISDRQIEHATRLIDAVGRQVGGWIKGVA